MVLLILLVNFASLYAQQFPMEDFIGVNIRREDPLKYLKPFGFVRDYRDWAVDEGDFYKNAPYGITLNDISNGANKYRFNPGIGTYVKYDDYYKEIQDQLGYGKICATMKSCLPLLAGGNGEDFAEFKPVKYQLSNSVTASSLTKDNIFTFTPTALTAPVVPSSEITKTARSYEWIADWVYQFTLKYGGGSTTSSPLKRFSSSDNTRNLNRVKYLELWNEPNKYWKRTNDQSSVPVQPVDDGWLKATKFDGKEFAAMASAVYDAHMNTITVNNGSGSTYNPSMISAAPNMKFANGGTAGIREYDWKFLIDMKNHFNNIRSSATIKVPIDVINFHHYNSSYWFGLQGLSSSDREGVSPEADCWKIGTLAGVDEYGRLGSGEGSVPTSITNIDPTTNYRTFKQRLIELKKKVNDEFGAGTELWMSEFGYDTNERSPYRAPNIFTNGTIVANRQEVQGRFLVRAYLEIAAAQWDRAMLFDLRDLNSKSDGILFDACGVVKDRANDYQPKTSYYYVSTLASALKNTKFKKEIKVGVDPTWILSNETDDVKKVYAQHSYNFTDVNCHRIAKFVKGTNPSATNAGDIVFAVWLPTSQNLTKSDVVFYFNDSGVDENALDASEGLPTLVTLIEPLAGDINGKNTPLTVMTDGSGRKYVTIPLITENPQYLCLGKSVTEPSIAAPSFNATGVSCDAIKLSITKTANTKYSVYYYEKNDRDENGTIPAFNLNDSNLKLFAEDIETADVLLGGLLIPHDNYHVFVVAVDKNFGTVSMATRVAASTLSCSNNVVITKASASVNDEIVKISDTKNFSLCYPVRGQQLNDLPQLYNVNEGYIFFTNNMGSLQEYNLHLASFWDAQGESDLTIQYCDDCSAYSEVATSTIPPTKWKTLVRDRFSLSSNKYKTIEYERWVHFPVNVKTDRIKITKDDNEARIRKLVFRGVPASNPAYNTLCCGANEPNLVTIMGNTTVSSQLSNGNLNVQGTRQVVRIDGTLTVDEGFYTDNNSLFYMTPGSKIVVNSGQSFYPYNTSFQGCDIKWQGIILEPGADVYSYKTNIRDASTAFSLQAPVVNGPGTWFCAWENVFEENETAIQNQYSATPNLNTVSGLNVIYSIGSTFDGNNRDLKPNYAGYSGWSTAFRALHGVDLQSNYYGYIGFPAHWGYPKNTFQNLAIGVKADNFVNLSVQGSLFKNINTTVVNGYFGPQDYGGFGILKQGSGFLGVRGYLDDNNPFTFDKVKVPIYSYNSSNVDIQYCNIKTTLDNSFNFWWWSWNYGGIYVRNDYGSPTTFNTIRNNRIFANGSGITVWDNNTSNIDNNFIESNEIDGFQSTVAGSSISLYSPTAVNLPHTINNNTINASGLKRSNGILLNNIVGANVNFNKITSRDYAGSTNLDSTFLINLISSSGNNIRNNTLTGTGGKFVQNSDGIRQTTYAVGINLTSAPQNNITCNNIKGVRIGISADGSNLTGTSSGIDGIAGNVFEDYNRGILLRSPTAVLGVHAHKMNRWKNIAALATNPSNNDPALSNKAAEFVGNTTTLQLLDNQFRVGNNTNNGANDIEINPTVISNAVRVNVGNATDWFVPQAASSIYTCTSVGAGFTNGSGISQTLQTRGDGESDFYAEGNHPFVNRKVVEDAAKVKKNMGISDASAWIMERDAYGYYKGKLKGNLPSTKALKDFFKKHDNGDIGTLAELDKEWLRLKEEEYREQAKEAETATKRLEELSAMQNRAFDPKKVIELKDAKKVRAYFKSFENDSIKILNKKLHDLNRDYADKLTKKAKKLLNINSRLSSDVAYVKYEKEINDMYFTLLGDKTVKLTKEQVSRVIEIAMMCPEDAGRAPFKARALYASLTAEPLPDWSNRCRRKEVVRPLVGAPTLNLSIYPNPAYDNIILSVEKIMDTEGYTWQITDIAGSTVKTGKFNNTIETINTTELNSGIYLIRVVKDSSIVKVEKFSIIK